MTQTAISFHNVCHQKKSTPQGDIPMVKQQPLPVRRPNARKKWCLGLLSGYSFRKRDREKEGWREGWRLRGRERERGRERKRERETEREHAIFIFLFLSLAYFV
jgi:hypothetical protein